MHPKVKAYAKVAILMAALVFCIETGNFLFYMLGLMIYGAWRMRDIYASFWGFYKNAMKLAWDGKLFDKKESKPPEKPSQGATDSIGDRIHGNSEHKKSNSKKIKKS